MSDQVWYYSQHGERKGPVTLEVLQSALSHGKIDIATDLVWGPGLSDWVKVHEVPELQGSAPAEPSSAPPVAAPAADTSMSNIVPPSEVAKARSAENPYASPESDNALQDAMNARNAGEYGGMGRLMYWFAPMAICLLVFLGLTAVTAALGVADGDGSASNPTVIAALVAYVVCILLCLFATFSRLKNLGMSRWAILWGLVPVMNIWLSFRLYVCPAGYNDHKKLDGAGKVVLGVYILVFVGSIALSVLFGGSSYYKQAADEAARQMEDGQTQQEASE